MRSLLFNFLYYILVIYANMSAGFLRFTISADFNVFVGETGVGSTTGKPLHYKGSIFHRVIKGFMAQVCYFYPFSFLK